MSPNVPCRASSLEEGVTFIELLVTVVIIGILAAIAVPYYGDYISRQRLLGATEAVIGQLQYGKRAAVSNNSDVFFVAKGAQSDNWCLTVAASVATVDASCNGGWIVSSSNPSIRVLGVNYPTVVLNASSSSIQTGFLMPEVRTSGTNTVSLSIPSSDIGYVQVSVSDVQRISICASNLSQYPGCP